MKITVIGASQGLGAYVVREGLARGHQMTAFSRHPEKLGIKDKNLRYVAGDARDAASLEPAIKGAEVVMITLGLTTLKAMGKGRSRVLSLSTENAVQLAKRHGVHRLILETAIGAGESKKQLGLINRFSLRDVLSWLFHEKDRQEELVRESGMPFVIVRPAALTNGPATGKYDVLKRTSLWRSGIFTQISRADVAGFMLDQVESNQHLGQAVIVSYRRSPLDFPRWLVHYR